ncbi:MAG: ABC transporter ATP-binding protein, partial [Thermoleophilaceae bacterium]
MIGATSAGQEGDLVEGAPALLSVRNLEVVYNDVALVLRGVSLD